MAFFSFQIMLFGQQSFFLLYSPPFGSWHGNHHDTGIPVAHICQDLSRADMGSKGELKGVHGQAEALGMGVGWDMRSSLSGACVCGPVCEHVSLS